MEKINSIIVIYNKYSGSYSENKIDGIYTFLKNIHSNVILKCSRYIGDIQHLCSLLPPNIIIVSCGGDGILHQIFNGLNYNINSERIYIATIPLGSGNHLAKQNNCNNIKDCLYKIVSFLKSGNLNEINPTEVHTEKNVILSINTIVGGPPFRVSSISNKISKYIPKFISILKYDIATLIYYFIYKPYQFKINNNSNINGFFFQTTKSCGNMILDKNVKLKSSEVYSIFFKENNFFKLVYLLIKIKNEYEDIKILKEKSINYTVEGKGYISIDGEDIKIKTPCKIVRSQKKFYLI